MRFYVSRFTWLLVDKYVINLPKFWRFARKTTLSKEYRFLHGSISNLWLCRAHQANVLLFSGKTISQSSPLHQSAWSPVQPVTWQQQQQANYYKKSCHSLQRHWSINKKNIYLNNICYILTEKKSNFFKYTSTHLQ